ncbi:MAG: HD domain-containing protein [Acutalibacter sp.]|nr:HD domain-containing protein [Acutalibacter sp.]MCI8922343.1 HD domain-containing protein [Acutalibacter sp.]
MNRIEVVKGIAGKIIEATLPKDRQAACIHLYGVSQACALLALRRGQDVELAVTAGLLHDLHTYYTGNPADHAHQGAALARELLSPTGLFTPTRPPALQEAERFRHLCAELGVNM